MDGVWSLNAPQWTDFASSPQPLDDDGYFDQEHEELEPKPLLTGNVSSVSPKTPLPARSSESELIEIQKNNDVQLDEELLKVDAVPIKVISPPMKKNDNVIVKETTFDNVLNEAMASLKLSTKKKSRRSMNVESTPVHSTATPVAVKGKASKSLRYQSTPSNPIPMWIRKTQQFTTDPSKIPCAVEQQSEIVTVHHPSQDETSIQHENEKTDIENDINTVVEICEETNKLDLGNGKNADNMVSGQSNVPVLNQVMPNDLRMNDTSSANTDLCSSKCQTNISERASYPKKIGPATFATSQLRRRSLTQYRRRSNKYVSMAEAIAKFQTGTPKRFRTTSTKNAKPKPLQRVRQSSVATVPISPALRCKLRARAKSVLSHEEREMHQVQEMRQNPIKANPVPSSISNAPVALSKKITAVPETSHLSENKISHDPKPKITVPLVVSTQDGITVKGTEILYFGIPDVTLSKSSATKASPFSFEMRNKELQRRREQKIKELMTEEEKKTKVSFHARPVPKFKKPMISTTKDTAVSKPNTKPCPFSFEERNKNMVKKKENLMKAMMDEDKKARMFQAKPVPEFKPVLVRGTSRENLCAKSKIPSAPKGRISMLPVAKTGSKNCLLVKKSLSNLENQNPVKNTDVSALPEPKLKSGDNEVASKQKATNILQDFHLNTDKRAKERKEFDAKIRQKELEGELLKKKAEVEKLAREEAEKLEMRRRAQTKARPMPIYKPPALIHSDKELTVPQSPGWSAKPGH